jgi:hypothetical protein
LKRWIAPAAAAMLLALGAAWFLSSFELAPARQWTGPSGEARRDPFLAAARFADRMGMRSRQVRALPQLDRLPSDGALLLPARRQAIDPRRLRQLVTWAESGGHLLVEAELPGVSDPLLDRLGVRRRAAGGEREIKGTRVETAAGRTLKVSFATRTVLELPDDAEAVFQAGAPDATVIASIETGRGMVTVASSLRFARNDAIGMEDNAEFFWYLLDLTPAKELSVFLRQERLSLWGFLAEHAAPVLIAGAALLLLWLWNIGPRFGPIAPDPPTARRRLLDHLRASGRYYWARGMRGRLVTAARDAALRHVAQAHPDFGYATPDQRAEHLAALAAMTPEEARRFMAAADAPNGADFVQLMNTAQRIHSALEKGNR